jgi:hypothetical protein
MKSTRPGLADFHCQVLMDDMMQAVGVDLLEAIDVDGGQSYVRARLNCHGCVCKEECRDWLSEHEHRQSPSFCPNAGFFQSLKGASD